MIVAQVAQVKVHAPQLLVELRVLDIRDRTILEVKSGGRVLRYPAPNATNVLIYHLDQMRSYARYLPSVNQFEIHPWLQRPGLRAATEAIGAIPEAYSPLARGKKIDDPRLGKIAKKIGVTPAQIAIKWCLDQGCITIPKSTNENRINENLASLNIDLTEVMSEINALEENYVSGWDPTAEP